LFTQIFASILPFLFGAEDYKKYFKKEGTETSKQKFCKKIPQDDLRGSYLLIQRRDTVFIAGSCQLKKRKYHSSIFYSLFSIFFNRVGQSRHFDEIVDVEAGARRSKRA